MTPRTLTIAAMLSTAPGPECDAEVALGIKRPSRSPGGVRDLTPLRTTVALRIHHRMRYLPKKDAINEITQELEHEHELELLRDPSPYRPPLGWKSFTTNCLNSLDEEGRKSVEDAFDEARKQEWKTRTDETDAMLERAKRAHKHSSAALRARKQHGVAYAVIWETVEKSKVQFKWYQTEEPARKFADALRKSGAWVHEVWKF